LANTVEGSELCAYIIGGLQFNAMAVAEREAAIVQEQGQAAPAIHLNTADGDSEPLKLQSLCMRCHETVSVI
jgi:hypothetical protein